MSENTTPDAPKADEGKEQTFTQADIDRIVRDRVKRERERFADYDDLKAKVEGAKSEADRIADLERRLADADAREQRTRLVQTVAAKFGIVDPEDVALFLTGQDEDTLTAQAKRLAARDEGRRKAGDIVRDAGKTPTHNGADSDVREFARTLFNSKE